MKKNVALLIAIMFFGISAFGQAVVDRNVIPVAVNLNQVLRMTILDGGNIEFVFNTIDEYKQGISGDVATSGSANAAGTEDMYRTNFTVSSSTRWKITYGAEQATFIGVDNPANILLLDNVGLTITESGTHEFESNIAGKGTTATEELYDAQLNAESGAEGTAAALVVYPANLIEDNDSGTQANAGDATDNNFTLIWRCGTGANLGEVANSLNPMNNQALIDQQTVATGGSPTADRYVANVLFELSVDN